MPFTCSTHRAFIYRLGGFDRIAELPSLSAVRWRRVRDDISTAEATVPTSECCDILADLRTIENELHIYRGDEVVWQGPITRLEYEADVTRIYAEDVLWQSTRCIIDQGYDQSHPNIGNVIDRMGWLLNLCYGRRGNPWRVNWHPIYGPDDPRTTRIVFAWQMYVWDDLDKYAEDYGADYTVYNRDVYFWDISLKWLVIPDLDESHLSQLPRIVEYGNQLGTRGVVTNGRGFSGVSPVAPGSLEHYGTIIDWLTTNEIDGAPGVEGEPPQTADAESIPTSEELASWADTATRSIAERYPAPVAIVIPANTTLLPGAPWEIHHMVPGAWFQVTTSRLCRTVSEWQRLQEVVVAEEAPNGETIQFSAVSAPAHPILYPGPLPDPPGYIPPPEPEPPIEPPVDCTDVLTEPFDDLDAWTISGTPAIWTIVAGRTGTCVQVTSSADLLRHSLGVNESADVTVGAAFQVSALPSQRPVLQLQSDAGGSQHLTVRVNMDGSLNLCRGGTLGTVLGSTTATGLVAVNTWNYLELQATLSDTIGKAQVRLNGSTVIGPLTGQDTKSAGTKTVFDTVALLNTVGATHRWDDLYLSTGPDCEFQGDPHPPVPLDCTAVLTEPFDNLTTNGWVTPAGRDVPTIVAGRTGTCARVAQFSTTQYNFVPDASDTVTVGFAYRASALGNTPQVLFLSSDGGTLIHFQLLVLTTGALRAIRMSVTTLATSAAGVIVPNVWCYIEAQIRVHDTAGFVIVRVDGVEVINVSGVDTRNSTGTTPLDQLMLQSSSFGSTHDYDDLYLLTGADCEFQGDPV